MQLSRSLAVAIALVALPSSALAGGSRSAAIAHPTRSTEVVIRVSTGGGFVALQSLLGAVPQFTLYGDGTVIVPGAVPQISPGPALRPLLRRQLAERQVQELLRRARNAGLLARGPVDYGDIGSVGIADAPSTTVHLHAAGRRVERDAYALGIDVGGGRLSIAQATARRALARFVDGLPDAPHGARYVPRSLVVYVAPAAAAGQPATATPVVWPLARPLATAGSPPSAGVGYRCIAVHGQAARVLLARLGTANDESRWVARGTSSPQYSLIARPLLPDETGCAALRG